MLVIRPSQLTALGKPALERYKERAIDTLRRHWPNRCAALGEEKLGKLVEGAFGLAEALRITAIKDVLRLCNVNMAVGTGWHELPEFSREAALLADGSLRSSVRLDMICERIQGRLEETF